MFQVVAVFFSGIIISQGSVAMRLRCGEYLIIALLKIMSTKSVDERILKIGHHNNVYKLQFFYTYVCCFITRF